jgi:hypothetical protein
LKPVPPDPATGGLKRDELPPVVAIACRALARDKHILAAR